MMICEGCKGFLCDQGYGMEYQSCTWQRPPDIKIPQHLKEHEKLHYWMVPWHHGCYDTARKCYQEGKDYQEYFLNRRQQRYKEKHPILWKIKSLLGWRK